MYFRIEYKSGLQRDRTMTTRATLQEAQQYAKETADCLGNYKIIRIDETVVEAEGKE